ncbi:hypothetical protein HC024_05395 [Methylococcaceae bacterium WWC4]|nr:hypothetical protein [Methylococcaceae bacterium WWC4]
MNVSASIIYVNQLNLLREDLYSLMGAWPSGPSFDVANQHAEAIAPLIAGQIQELQDKVRLNSADPMKLRSELEKLCDLMTGEEKSRFAEYVAMLDSLISDGAE